MLDADRLANRIDVGSEELVARDRSPIVSGTSLRSVVVTGATLAAVVTSCAVKKDPSATGHELISGKSMSVPSICVFQFWFPATIWPRVCCEAAV